MECHDSEEERRRITEAVGRFGEIGPWSLSYLIRNKKTFAKFMDMYKKDYLRRDS